MPATARRSLTRLPSFLRSYAIDLETERPINATHAAVLFDDRVTQPNFLAPKSSLPDAPGKGDARDGQGRNCSYFALASIDKVQKRLIAMCDDLRARGVADRAGAPAAPPKPWDADAAAPPAAAAAGGRAVGVAVVRGGGGRAAAAEAAAAAAVVGGGGGRGAAEVPPAAEPPL